MPCIRLLDSSAFGNGAWPEFLHDVWAECVFLFMCFLLHLILFYLFSCFFANGRCNREASFRPPAIQRQKRKAFVLAFSVIRFACWSSILFFSVCAETPERKFRCGVWFRLDFPTFFHLFFLLQKSCEIVYQTPSASSAFSFSNITIAENVARTSHWRRNAGLQLRLADWSYVELDSARRVDVGLFFILTLIHHHGHRCG